MGKKEKFRERRVSLLYAGDIEGFSEESSIAYWQSLSGEERLKATWELTRQAWLMKGKAEDELRLDRTTALFKRIQG